MAKLAVSEDIKKGGVTVYVDFTRVCWAKCEFCGLKERHDVKDFDVAGLLSALTEWRESHGVDSVIFVGGEPTMRLSKLEKLIVKVRGVVPEARVVVCTNGFVLPRLPELGADLIMLSRRHWVDSVNADSFGVLSLPSTDTIKSVASKCALGLSCVMLKGYVDSAESVRKYVEWAKGLGVLSVQFGYLPEGAVGAEEFGVEPFDVQGVGVVKTELTGEPAAFVEGNYMTGCYAFSVLKRDLRSDAKSVLTFSHGRLYVGLPEGVLPVVY